jgi:hypothetical protein
MKPETIARRKTEREARQIPDAKDRINRAMAIYNRDKVNRPENAAFYLEIARETAKTYGLTIDL